MSFNSLGNTFVASESRYEASVSCLDSPAMLAYASHISNIINMGKKKGFGLFLIVVVGGLSAYSFECSSKRVPCPKQTNALSVAHHTQFFTRPAEIQKSVPQKQRQETEQLWQWHNNETVIEQSGEMEVSITIVLLFLL